MRVTIAAMPAPVRKLTRLIPRFGLAALMLWVTAACVGLGLAINYPARAIQCVMVALPLAPTVVLWLVLAANSRRPMTITAMSVLGSCVSVWIFPSNAWITAKPAIVRIPGQPQLYFDVIELGLVSVGFALGTVLFGGALLIDEFRRRQRHDRPMDNQQMAAGNPG